MSKQPYSKAMISALQAVARVTGDSEVSAADLKKVLAAALGRPLDGEEDDDRDGRPH